MAKPSRKSALKNRSASRLAAVQALFQIEHTGCSPHEVILEFITYRFKNKEEGLIKANTSFFRKLVEGAWRIHNQSDEMIHGALKQGWTLDRIEPVARAILRAALYEICETQTPSAVIIDEYLNITHGFFDEAEVSFVNGVLNTITQKIRPTINS